jgi:hypothetical protein
MNKEVSLKQPGSFTQDLILRNVWSNLQHHPPDGADLLNGIPEFGAYTISLRFSEAIVRFSSA